MNYYEYKPKKPQWHDDFEIYIFAIMIILIWIYIFWTKVSVN